MGLVAEIVLAALAFAIFFGYHFWFFILRGNGLTSVEETFSDIFGAGKLSRTLFTAEILQHPQDAIIAIQNFRNCIMANTFFATIVSLLASQILGVILDKDGSDRIEELYRADPIVGDSGAAISPIILLSLLMADAFFAILAFVNSVRMYVHAGFFFKAFTSALNKTIVQSQIVAIILNAQAAFTIGMRMLFFLFVMSLWIVGPIAFVVASTVATAAIAWLDQPPRTTQFGWLEVSSNQGDEEMVQLQLGSKDSGVEIVIQDDKQK